MAGPGRWSWVGRLQARVVKSPVPMPAAIAWRSACWLIAAVVGVAWDGVILVVLAALPFLFFWRLLATTPGDVASFPIGDITELHYPYRSLIAAELAAHGRLPFWDPYVAAGHPALGDIQHALFYPVGLLVLAWTGADFTLRALAVQVALHFSIAAVFTYLLGRRLFAHRASAAFAAVAFTFGGYLTSFPVQQIGILQTVAWLPALLLCLELAIAAGSVALALPAAVVVGIAALAGHPQSLLYLLVGAAGYAVFCGWDRRWRGLAAAPVLVVAVGGGLALAAPQLLPAYEHLQLTDRTTAPYAFTEGGFAPHELAGLVFPVGFGGLPLYSGLATIVLAVLALPTIGRSRVTAYWVVLGVGALLLALGSSTFLQHPLYLALGSFKLRDQQRVAFLLTLALAMLAARAVDAALAGRLGDELGGAIRRLRWFLLAPVGLFLWFSYGGIAAPGDARGAFPPLADRAAFTFLILALTLGWLEVVRRRAVAVPLAGLLIVALVGLDLWTTTGRENLRPGPPEALFPETPIVKELRRYASLPVRVASEGALPADGNAGALYRFFDTVGNSPLTLDTVARFDREVAEFRRWQLLAVRFVVTRRDFDADGRFTPLARDGDVRLYEIKPDARGARAWVVYQAQLVRSFDEALPLVDRIDPRQVAVIHTPAGEWGPPALPELPPTPPTAPPVARIANLTAESVVVEVTSAAPGLLVVSEIWHPDWRATVDGTPVAILPTNGVLRGVPILAGIHRVELRFAPESFPAGREIAEQALVWGGQILLVEIVLRALAVVLRGGLLGVRVWRAVRPAARRDLA